MICKIVISVILGNIDMTTRNRFSKLAGLLTEGDGHIADGVEEDNSSEALHTMDPADDPEASLGSGGGLSADLSAGYELGAYGVATMSEISALQNIVLQEMKRMEEGMFDFLGSLAPSRWKDASGMEHPDMGGGPAPIPVDRAAYDLATALVDRIESTTMWTGPESTGAMEIYDRKGWHRIDGPGSDHLQTVVGSTGMSPDVVESVLDQWESSGYIARTEPDVLRVPNLPASPGVWLKWSGYQSMKDARDKGQQSGRLQFGT